MNLNIFFLNGTAEDFGYFDTSVTVFNVFANIKSAFSNSFNSAAVRFI